MIPPRPRLHVLLAALLVLSTIAFPLGIAAERAANEAGRQEAAAPAASGEAGEGALEQGEEGFAGEETEEHRAAEAGASESAEPGGEAHIEEAAGETSLFGIDLESNAVVAAVVILTLLLAVAVWRWPTPMVLGGVALFALLFAALDIREVLHQAAESRGGLVAVALLVALLHLAIAAVAVAALREKAPGRGHAAA